MTADNNTTETIEPAEEFGSGYFVFFGAVAGFFVTAAVALTVIMGYSLFQDGPAEAAPPPPVDTTVADGGTSTGDPAAGAETFASTCSVCHGAGAVGVEGLGPPLIDNAFIGSLSDDELLAFIKEGRLPDHPDNTTGVAMPPKGGNPSLTDEDLNDVIAYLRTLN